MLDYEIRSRKLNKIVPRRKYPKGQHPSMSGKEAMKHQHVGDEVEQDKFVSAAREATEEEKILQFATALECGSALSPFIMSFNLPTPPIMPMTWLP